MLDYIRNNTKSPVIKIVLGIICVVFIFFLGGGTQLLDSGSQNIATVGDIPVSYQEFQRAQRAREAQFRNSYQKIPAEIFRQLTDPANTISQLIDFAVIEHEAKQMGLHVPDEAVRLDIRGNNVFHKNGGFSPETYRDVLKNNNISPAVFEEDTRRNLLREQLYDVVRLGATVTEDEARKAYVTEQEQIKVNYLTVPAADYIESIETPNEALETYFAENAENYRKADAVKVRYLEYTAEGFADEDSVTEEAIKAYYDRNLDKEFTTEETVGARHILKKVAKDADEETVEKVRAEIDTIAKRLADGEDFATLAKKESEDTGSAVKDGDLGVFGRGRMVPPFEEAAFNLDVDSISDVVKSDFGFHIIQVYEKNPANVKTLEDATADIRKKLAVETATNEILGKASEDALAIHEGIKFDVIAEGHGLEPVQSDAFAAGEPIGKLGPAPELANKAFGLTSVGDTTDAVRVGKNYYIAELTEKIPTHIPSIEEVRDAVTEDYKNAKALEAAEARANELLERAKAGEDLAAIAESTEALELRESEAFRRAGDAVPGIGNIPGFKEPAFDAEEGAVLDKIYVADDNAYVFMVAEKIPVEDESFDLVKDRRIDRMRRSRAENATQEFINTLKNRVPINYNEVLISQITR